MALNCIKALLEIKQRYTRDNAHINNHTLKHACARERHTHRHTCKHR